MNADEAKAIVLAKYDGAYCEHHHEVEVMDEDADSRECWLIYPSKDAYESLVYSEESEDAAWIDAAKRIEQAQKENDGTS